MGKKITKKQLKKFWSKFFGIPRCPYCGRNLTQRVEELEKHGVDEEIYDSCPIGQPTRITSDFDYDWLRCPYCKESFEVYLIRGKTDRLLLKGH